MEQIIAGAPAGGNAPPIKDTNTDAFVADVIDASQETPVIVDFWAPWCGPCKQLTPVLEKVVQAAGGKVRMVKLNIDENPEIPQQMRVQSIPAVFAFAGGRPVDGFVGVQSESQIKAFVEKLAKMGGGGGPSPVEEALAQAEAALNANDVAGAANIYNQILQHEPTNTLATAGVIRCLLAIGDTAQARATFDQISEDLRKEAEVVAVRSALELAERGAAAGDAGVLQAQVDANPGDHQMRFDLAIALYGGGDADGAIDALIEIIRQDRNWNDAAARTELLKFFEALGNTHAATVAGRRKLSSLLFS